MEHMKPNAAKIPNICDHFQIPCVDLQRFMENEELDVLTGASLADC